MVTHEIDSVFAVADRVLFLDDLDKTMTALGSPQTLASTGPPRVREFLHRGRPQVDGRVDTQAPAQAETQAQAPGQPQGHAPGHPLAQAAA